MEWTFRPDLPIYSQLAHQLTLAILSGAYPAGARLPAVRDLAAEAGVNPNTMQRAMAELELQGLIYSLRTSGRFVTDDTAVIEGARKRLARRQAENFLSGMSKLGYDRRKALALLTEPDQTDKEAE